MRTRRPVAPPVRKQPQVNSPLFNFNRRCERSGMKCLLLLLRHSGVNVSGGGDGVACFRKPSPMSEFQSCCFETIAFNLKIISLH